MRYATTLLAAAMMMAGCQDSTTAPVVDPDLGVSPAMSEHAALPVEGCFVRGHGTLDSGDRFVGLASDRGPRGPRGVWVHTLPSIPPRQRLVGTVESLDCQRNGALLIVIGGTGRFGGVGGHTFDVVIQDTQNPDLPDTYRVFVRDSAGDLVYVAIGVLVKGDVVGPPN